jgi:hypothetical protein
MASNVSGAVAVAVASGVAEREAQMAGSRMSLILWSIRPKRGRAPEPNVRWWQDRLTPVWKRIGGGCHLNRAIEILIEDAGFQFDRCETGYMRGPKPLTFMYEGSARPR